jgi:glycosyltransferase involved in cell wall biosynthesis
MKIIDKNNFTAFDKNIFKNTTFLNLNPKVSICLLTYNQQNYIGQALDSILEQKVNFEYEIVIGDDASTDNNVEIINKYIAKHPTKIRAYFHPINLGPKKFPGKNNFLHSFFNCNGQYIVHIEGDDYFCDPTKLQKQVDFLDNNPTYSACFHNAIIKWEDDSGRPDEYINPSNQKNPIEVIDLLAEKETWFMATASVMMRRVLVHPLPAWFADTVSGDIPLYIILASQGPIGYLPDVMAVYRKNLAGQSFVYKLYNASFVKNRINLYKNLNEYTQNKYKGKIDAILADYYGLLASANDYKKNIFKRTVYSVISLKYLKNYNWLFWKNTLRTKALHDQALNTKNLKKWLFDDIFSSEK